MIEHCSLYLSVKNPPLKKVLPDCKSDGGLFRPPSWFQIRHEGDSARLSLMPEAEIEAHLNGFRGYVAQLPDPREARIAADGLIRGVRTVLGVTFDPPVGPDSPCFQIMFFLLQRFDGFMFINDSILRSDGECVAGPMRGRGQPETEGLNPDDFRQEGPTEGLDPERVALRERHYFELACKGFRAARWLPIRSEDESQLRPHHEILARVNALNALFLWVTVAEIPTAGIQDFISRNALLDQVTSPEREILSMDRAKAQRDWQDKIGWRLENMWALCWVLGFEPAPAWDSGQLPDQITRKMIFEFLPNFQAGIALRPGCDNPRSAAEVLEMEDLFYCAHNAVRSAQTGRPSVPAAFDPIRDGGAIHERRHSLTWCLSPGTDWDDTDLST